MAEKKQYHYLRELTPEEAELAEKHHDLVFKFIYSKRLDEVEWYDVVIFHYLRQIQNYLENKELQKYDIRKLLFSRMEKAVLSERQKGSVSVTDVISIDEYLPGIEDVTYAEVITRKNLRYTHTYTGDNLKNMKYSKLKEERSCEE